jgi:hypothetical protein
MRRPDIITSQDDVRDVMNQLRVARRAQGTPPA